MRIHWFVEPCLRSKCPKILFPPFCIFFNVESAMKLSLVRYGEKVRLPICLQCKISEMDHFFLICCIKLESNKLRKVAAANFLKRLWSIRRAQKVPNMVQKRGFQSFDKSLIYSWGRFPRIWNYLMVF